MKFISLGLLERRLAISMPGWWIRLICLSADRRSGEALFCGDERSAWP